MEFADFRSQFFAASSRLQDAIEANRPTQELPAPVDWPSLQSIVRAVAEDLMLAPDVDSAIARLQQDQAALLAVVHLTTDMRADEDIELLLRRAHAAMPADTPILPFRPFCSYLIQLCDHLEPP